MAVPPPFPDTTKAALRRDLRQRRQAFVSALGPASLAAHLAAVEERLRPLLARAGPIGGHVAHRREVDVLPFLLAAFHAGHEVALPRVEEDESRMTFRPWYPDLALAPGHAGIAEPPAGQEAVEPAIVLAPLLGFDRAGGRLGQGGGFYDRWFAAHPRALRVGIGWSVQQLDACPREPWDMPLHAIVTEKEWIAP